MARTTLSESIVEARLRGSAVSGRQVLYKLYHRTHFNCLIRMVFLILLLRDLLLDLCVFLSEYFVAYSSATDH